MHSWVFSNKRFLEDQVVRGQPHIDALDMEAMVAPRVHAYLLIALVVLAETNGAFNRRDVGAIFADFIHHHRHKNKTGCRGIVQTLWLVCYMNSRQNRVVHGVTAINTTCSP
ncbi:hypothetical protein SETIT_8G178600v2 [Setaria italica]|uniref:Uncharacterized protein n=1 Tax=Setaria italica TaxID=4555 RepID=A0A368S946_SETIT|nr:hypothetical protein SETIT_8G178600v2 [Setaria italica]